jgi:cell division protein FtsI (penicillin-binding protein 3)
LPAEATGTLREPRSWSKQTSASLLMGYEIAVTPLQLVSAYAAIANGGELLEPHLVKEVRSADGKVVYRAEPRPVRRVMSGEVARTVQQMLLSVVQEGTATKADLETFDVAGKSGTARRTTGAAGYTTGNYTASFVGLFPAKDPQYVVLVKLDSPKGAHYAGGDIAAPVTRVVLRAALASRDAALNRDELAASEKNVVRPAEQTEIKTTSRMTTSRGAGVTDEDVAKELASIENRLSAGKLVKKVETAADDETAEPEPVSSLVQLVKLPASRGGPPPLVTPQPVPDVRNLGLREAVRAIHSAGFRVQLQTGSAAATSPAAGTMAGPGTLVVLTRPRE